MKNIKYIIITLIMLLVPTFVYAVDIDYKVEAAYVTADLDILGSLHIKEAYVVKGSLNGYRRNIVYKNSALKEWEAGNIDFSNSSIYNGRNLVLSKVSAFNIDEEEIGWGLLDRNVEKFEEVDSANTGDKGKYTKEEHEDGMDIKTYNTNEDGYIVYFYEYYVDQVAVLHEDVAELYYTFFKLDSDDVKKVNIQVTTPGQSTDDVFRFWAHGSLNGEIRGISESKDKDGKNLYKGVLVTLEDYKAGDVIEVRMTFDRRILEGLSNVLNNSKEVALDKIIAVETELADAANARRKFAKVAYFSLLSLSIAYLIGLIALWIYMYLKYDKEHKNVFDYDYYREFTGDYNVEVVDYLMNKNITTNAMNASIMNLIYKKNIEIEEIPDEKKNSTLVLKSRDNVNKTESILLDLLFDTIGNGERVTLKEIEKYSSNYTTAQTFMKKYHSWETSALMDGKAEGFFEDLRTPRTSASLYLILGLILIALIIFMDVELYVFIPLILIGSIAFIIYVWSFKKWSVKGREHYLKWNAFKKFLEDFGNFKDKEIPEVKLWDKYLVYATVFGIAKKVQKAMQVQLTNMDVDQNTINTSMFYYRDMYVMNSISSSMSNAYTKSSSTITAHEASSSMSSGSGFGGGFSGGGGFAGGGGGGGGF